MNMNAHALLDRLFPAGHAVTFEDAYFHGHGTCLGAAVAVLGTSEEVEIGVELALAMARDVLDVVKNSPKCPILLLVATTGQRLSRRDEMLGINAYLAHLAKTIDLAKREGHPVVSLVWSRAVSGGFLATSMLADLCFALPEAEIGVMNLPAMARITKIPLERLESLSTTSPVFAPGVANYLRMGAIEALWEGDLEKHLDGALHMPSTRERRRVLGDTRGGRQLARSVAERVRSDERG
jgi:malonate decarboxylase gamma subunit